MIRMLEISWLVLALVALVLSCYKLITDGLSDAIFFLVVTAGSFAMYFVRRRQRVRMNKETGM